MSDSMDMRRLSGPAYAAAKSALLTASMRQGIAGTTPVLSPAGIAPAAPADVFSAPAPVNARTLSAADYAVMRNNVLRGTP